MGPLVSRLAPPLLLMALIFYLSAQPNLKTDLGLLDLILRKLAHMTEYAALWGLWWRALGYRHALAAAAIALGYAATDEFHQTFVDGRVGTPVDVAIDAAGIALAALAARRYSQPRSVA
jgi:VanZ family protein